MCLTKKYKYQHLYTPGDVNNKYMNANICISQKMFITSCILEQGRKNYHSIKNYLLANRSMELCQEYWRFTVNHSQISWGRIIFARMPFQYHAIHIWKFENWSFFFSDERRIIQYSLLTLPFREDIINQHIKLKRGEQNLHMNTAGIWGKKKKKQKAKICKSTQQSTNKQPHLSKIVVPNGIELKWSKTQVAASMRRP